MNILLVMLIAVLLVWGIYLFLQRAPKYGPGLLVRLGLFIAFIALIIMALTGRLHWVLGILAGLLPLAKRLLPLFLLKFLPATGWGQAGPQQPTTGQQSNVETPTLRMILEHDTGDMDGEVVEGPHQGSRLSTMTIEQLGEFHTHCQLHDTEGLRLLESYLHRHREDEWQAWYSSQQHYSDNTGNAAMSFREALEILELEPDPTEAEIQQAHKRMMAKFHPDRGGSHYMAVKINQAKDLLLSRL